MSLTPETEALKAMWRMIRDAQDAWYATLPPAPTDTCPKCGSTDDFRVVEEGYSRFTMAETFDGYWLAHTNGWDDMSESGEFEYIECWGDIRRDHPNDPVDHCGTYFQMPGDITYS